MHFVQIIVQEGNKVYSSPDYASIDRQNSLNYERVYQCPENPSCLKVLLLACHPRMMHSLQ